MIPLSLNPDRLFSSDPTQRALARALYATVRDLPIVSPHGHTDPQWFADNEPFSNASALFITPDHYVFRMLYSQGLQLEDLGIARRQHAADTNVVDIDARTIWRTPGAELSSFPRHADAPLARPRVPRGIRHSRAAHRGVCRPAVRPHQRLSRQTGVPSARAVRALQHRGDRDHRVATRSACASCQDSRQRMEGPGRDRVPSRPGRRSGVRRLRRERRLSRRDLRRRHDDMARLSRRAPRSPRLLQDDGRDFAPITVTRPRRPATSTSANAKRCSLRR